MTTTSDNDRFELRCRACDVNAIIEITLNPQDSYGDVGPRCGLREDGGWTCFNCASQNVTIKKLE